MQQSQKSKVLELMGKELYILQVGGFFFLVVIVMILFNSRSKDVLTAETQFDLQKKKAEEAYKQYQGYKNKNNEIESKYNDLLKGFSLIGDKLKTNPDLKDILKALGSLQTKVDQFKDVIDQPPIIALTSSGGFTFPSGQMILSKGFREKLETVVIPQIINNSLTYSTDLVVISGHTDEIPMYERGAPTSTFDKDIIPFLKGKKKTLQSVSNTELGLSRALAVVLYLKSKPELGYLKIVPYSGGQLIQKNNILTKGEPKADKERRRIEIWLQRSHL